MPYEAYPQDSDIQAFIVSSGVDLGSYVTLGIAAAAQREWERLTGWIPFLGDLTDVTRVFDPPGSRPLDRNYSNNFYGGSRLLELKAGLLSLTTLVAPSQTMTLGTDFRLTPLNAPIRNRPYEQVEFFVPLWGPPSSIQITGKWGFAVQLPDDVYQAVLRLGAAMVAEDILQGIYASPSVIKIGEDQLTQDGFRDFAAAWRSVASRIAKGYAFVRLGI